MILNQIDLLYKLANLNDQRLIDLGNIKSFVGRIKFAVENFTKIAAGSSRAVFDYGDYVIKIAKNAKGIAQNTTESDWFLQKNYSDIIANIVYSDNNHYFVVSQKAKKITESRFKQITGIGFKEFGDYIFNRLTFKKCEDINSELAEEILDLASNFAMPAGDFQRISSYGEINGKVILTDYGLTDDILKTYYK